MTSPLLPPPRRQSRGGEGGGGALLKKKRKAEKKELTVKGEATKRRPAFDGEQSRRGGS